MAEAVIDASALLAYMRGESGADEVAAALERGCTISAINLAEVLSKLTEVGDDPEDTLARLATLGDALRVEGVEIEDVRTIARLRPTTEEAGLSLADRACLALALRLGLPALTADRSWHRVDVGVVVIDVR